MQLQGELCKYWIIWFNGQTKNNHGQKKFPLNLLEIKAKGGGLAQEKKTKEEMFAFKVVNPLFSIFDLKRQKMPTKLNNFFKPFLFSLSLIFFFFFVINLHHISCHTKVDLVSLENLFSSASLLLKNTAEV